MTMHYRTMVSAGDGFDFVISDGSMDRHGTRINPNGWDLSEFNKNPIALWAHGRDPVRGTVPIGRWENVRVEAGRLVGRLVLLGEGKSAFVDELRQLMKQGILRAVSVGMDYIKEGKRGGPWEIERAGLREVSPVAVGSNPNALQLARSIDISESTIRTVFGEQADENGSDVSTGEHAVTSADRNRSREDVLSNPKETKMKTISQRLDEATTKLAARQQRHAELINADDLDTDAIEAASADIERMEKEVAVLTASEARIAKGSDRNGPALLRRPLGFPQKEVKPFDLLVRKAVVSSVAMFTDKPVDKVLDDRYPGHEATAALLRDTAAVAATTGGSHNVDDLQQIAYQGFVDALDGMSVLPPLRAGGLALNLDSAGTAYVPGVAAGGAGGSFFAEGSPIRVGTLATNNVQMTSRKVGVIMVFSREAAKRSTPDLEALFRRRMLADTATAVDSVLLDNSAQTSVRPGGLLYDQVATAAISAAASGYGGGDHVAVMKDFQALMAPFIAANAATGITVVMNPAQGLALDFMTGPDGALGDWFSRARARFNFVESTHATAARLIAVRAQDFASAIGGVEFEMSSSATLHMEQTQADVEQIVTSGTAASASPVRSLYQTDTKGVRMVWDLNWRMMRQGMVQWIDGTSW